MSFWDRLVWALYFGLDQHAPAGRLAALRIVEMALSRQAFLATLGNGSLLLLLALLPLSSPHRVAVVALAQARQLFDPAVRLAIGRAAAPLRLTEVVESYRPQAQDTRNAAMAALLEPGHLLLYENLHLFLARRFLIDPDNPDLRLLLGWVISRATSRYARIPIGTVEYLCYLYRVVFWHTGPNATLPAMSPPSLNPGWYVNLQAEERHLIRAAIGWPEETQELFYLHFCALLTVEQIGCVLDLVGPGDPDAIIHDLEQCWDAVL